MELILQKELAIGIPFL